MAEPLTVLVVGATGSISRQVITTARAMTSILRAPPAVECVPIF
ncbi:MULTISPECIES: hypothetical protein [unclassified Curtobacterium]